MSQDKAIYLDYAAATPLDPQVLTAMQPYLQEHFANPSSLHAAGRQQRQALERARADIADVLGAKPIEIIFTSGSTEAINLAVHGVLAAYEGGQAVALAVEHEAVLRATSAVNRNPMHRPVGVGADGKLDMERLKSSITDTTVLVCVQYANNETGVVQPITQVAKLIEEVRQDRANRNIERPIYLFCDAAQAGLLSLQVSRLGVDLLSMGGSKLYGPSGSGFLYIRTGVDINPIWVGGGQERGLRGGTQNVAAAVGMAKALQLVQADRSQQTAELANLRDWLATELEQAVGDIRLNGHGDHRLPGFLNITVARAKGEDLVAHLDAAGLQVATGSACTAANQEPSHVLLAMGLTHAQAESSLRITLGKPTTRRDAEEALKTLIKVIGRARELSAQT